MLFTNTAGELVDMYWWQLCILSCHISRVKQIDLWWADSRPGTPKSCEPIIRHQSYQRQNSWHHLQPQSSGEQKPYDILPSKVNGPFYTLCYKVAHNVHNFLLRFCLLFMMILLYEHNALMTIFTRLKSQDQLYQLFECSAWHRFTC